MLSNSPQRTLNFRKRTLNISETKSPGNLNRESQDSFQVLTVLSVQLAIIKILSGDFRYCGGRLGRRILGGQMQSDMEQIDLCLTYGDPEQRALVRPYLLMLRDECSGFIVLYSLLAPRPFEQQIITAFDLLVTISRDVADRVDQMRTHYLNSLRFREIRYAARKTSQ